MCAKRLVLAMPPKPLSQIDWQPISSTPKIQDSLDSVEEVPALRIYFVYNESWWDDSEGPPKQPEGGRTSQGQRGHGSAKRVKG